jgi:glutathione S-transferase
MPALRDPNNGDVTIWESGAIIQYLITTYDINQKLSFPPNSPASWHATQYLFFQVSGQGPYYGNGFYFAKFAQPPNDAAVERFIKEAERVTGVLDGMLAKAEADADGRKWLVGGKCSYADLSFVPYQLIARLVFKDMGFDEGKFPEVKKWVDAMFVRESVKKVLSMTEPWKDMGLYSEVDTAAGA